MRGGVSTSPPMGDVGIGMSKKIPACPKIEWNTKIGSETASNSYVSKLKNFKNIWNHGFLRIHNWYELLAVSLFSSYFFGVSVYFGTGWK